MLKRFVMIAAAMLFALNCYAGETFVSYQSSAFVPEDDNFGQGKGFFAQAAEAGYSWKYLEAGVEWYTARLQTTWRSSFMDSSVMGTIKLKYPIKKLTPYAVAGVGSHFFHDKDMRAHPDNPIMFMQTVPNDVGFALKWGGGLQYQITKNFTIFTEAAYRYGDTGKMKRQGDYEVDVYGWGYSLGAKVYF